MPRRMPVGRKAWLLFVMLRSRNVDQLTCCSARMRDKGPLVSRRCARGLTGLPLLGRAVVLCAVLSGLFLMHGAAPPTGGCQGGGAAMTATTMPVTSAAGTANVTSGTDHGTATLTSAGKAAAPVPRAGEIMHPAASAAAGQMSAASGGGMLCSSRPPRDALAGALMIFLASAAISMTAPARARPPTVFRRACRPPGPPGLPLPLFLGVSRT